MTWWERFFLAVDEKAAQRLGDDWFAADFVLQFGNWPQVTGKNAAVAALDQFFGSIEGLSHQLVNVVSEGSSTVVESVVTYRRLDGTNVALPAATLLEREGDKLRCLRIYVDQSPLHAAKAA